MALRKLIVGGNNVTELRHSGIVSFKENCKWKNRLRKTVPRQEEE
jgi:hypothetical protein